MPGLVSALDWGGPLKNITPKTHTWQRQQQRRTPRRLIPNVRHAEIRIKNHAFPRAAAKYLSLSWSSVPGNGWTTKWIDVIGSVRNGTQARERGENDYSSVAARLWTHRNRLMAEKARV